MHDRATLACGTGIAASPPRTDIGRPLPNPFVDDATPVSSDGASSAPDPAQMPITTLSAGVLVVSNLSVRAPSTAAALEQLRVEARRAGADALAEPRFQRSADGVEGTALAVSHVPDPNGLDVITDADRARGAQVIVVESLGTQRAEVVGPVEIEEPPGLGRRGLADLRARAAQLGAEGLTSIEVHAAEEGATRFSGLAVRFRDVLRGRPYEVLGELEFDASSLREDEIYTELRRRAHRMHADLLLDVRVELDASGALQVHAEAVRLLER